MFLIIYNLRNNSISNFSHSKVTFYVKSMRKTVCCWLTLLTTSFFIAESRLRRKGSRLSLERLERKMKSLHEQPFQGKLVEKTDSEDAEATPRMSTANSFESQQRYKLNSMDSTDSMSTRPVPHSNGKVPDGARPKKDEGLGESLDQQSDGSNKGLGGGIVNPAYEALPEEAETHRSELPLDPSKLASDHKSVPPAKVFSDKDGPSKKVSFGGAGDEPEPEQGDNKYIYDGTNGLV